MAIVGFGKVVVRPWVVDGAIGPRSVVTVTLSADHRVSDGHAGALFLSELRQAALDIDSLDFLNFVTAIHHRLGVDIPETDYPELLTLAKAVAYLTAHLGSIKS